MFQLDILTMAVKKIIIFVNSLFLYVKRNMVALKRADWKKIGEFDADQSVRSITSTVVSLSCSESETTIVRLSSSSSSSDNKRTEFDLKIGDDVVDDGDDGHKSNWKDENS